MTSDKKTRRRYSESKKTPVLAECSEPGTSVAKVVMAQPMQAASRIDELLPHRWTPASSDS